MGNKPIQGDGFIMERSLFDGQQGTFSDYKCSLCNVDRPRPNPEGWRVIDDVPLTSVWSWAERP